MQLPKLLVLVAGATILLSGISQAMVVIEEQADGITLVCPDIKEWEKDGVNYARLTDNGNVKLTRLSDSDTGKYSCTDGHERSSAYVFVKLCRNCVALDPSTISGIVVGDLIATIFIAVAIYCVTSSNKGKGYRARLRKKPPLTLDSESIKTFKNFPFQDGTSDKQNLVPQDHNDVYQDLGKRRGSCEYSQLAPRLKI